MNITGNTRFIAHLGVPTHSFTAPRIFNPWFSAQGVDCVVVPMGCEADDFAAFLPLLFRQRNIVGALITMPHKTAVPALLDRAAPAVDICGACNAVRRDDQGRLVGDMFDGQGFVRALRATGRDPLGASAFILGAGGVGSAIAASLAAAGVARLGLLDSGSAATAALAARLSHHYPALEILTDRTGPAGFDIAINATPLGMAADDPLPFDPSTLTPSTPTPGALVGEVVLKPAETPLLEASRALGLATVAGSDMLFEQIPAYLDFFNLPPASAQDLRRTARLDP